MFGHQRIGQFADVTVHHLIHLVQGQVDAVVGNAALREVVSADAFRAVTAAHQALARGGGLGILLANLCIFDTGCQHAHCLRLVLML